MTVAAIHLAVIPPIEWNRLSNENDRTERNETKRNETERPMTFIHEHDIPSIFLFHR